MSKTYTLLGLIAIAILLFGFASSGIGWILALIATLVLVVHVLNIYHLDRNEQNKKTAVMMLLVIGILGLTGFTIFNVSLPQTVTVPQASVINDNIASGTGEYYTGEFNFIPTNNGGYPYASSGRVTITDIQGNRYDFMKLIVDSGEPAITFRGSPSKWYTQSSNKFQETQLSGRVGDRFNLFGYVDITPTNRENISFVKTVELDNFNPQSGTNGGIWNWHFVNSNDNRYQWNVYPLMDWMDSANTLRNGYIDKQTSATTGQQKIIYLGPQGNGEEPQDMAIYVGSPSTTISNLKKISVTTPRLKTAEATTFIPLTDLQTGSPEYKAAPAVNASNSGEAMYYALKIPYDGTWRTGNTSSTRNIYKVTIDYDHPASATDWLLSIYVTENSGALTSTGGHFDIADDFVINATAVSNDNVTTQDV